MGNQLLRLASGRSLIEPLTEAECSKVSLPMVDRLAWRRDHGFVKAISSGEAIKLSGLIQGKRFNRMIVDDPWNYKETSLGALLKAKLQSRAFAEDHAARETWKLLQAIPKRRSAPLAISPPVKWYGSDLVDLEDDIPF